MHRLRIRIFLFAVLLLAAALGGVLVLLQRSAEQFGEEQARAQLAQMGAVLQTQFEQQRRGLQRQAALFADDLAREHRPLPGARSSEPLDALLQRLHEYSDAAVLAVIDGDARLLAQAPQETSLPALGQWAGLVGSAMVRDRVLFTPEGAWLLAAAAIPPQPLQPPRWLVLAAPLDGAWLQRLLNGAEIHASLLRGVTEREMTLASAGVALASRARKPIEARLPLAGVGDTLALRLQRHAPPSLADSRLLHWQMLAIALAALIGAAVGALWIGNSISRPLAAMVRYMRRVGDGDYAAPPPAERRGEVGALAREFAFMLSAMAQREASIRHLAYHDSLTGLPNRNRFNALIDDALMRGSDTRFAVLVMDIDRFRDINDTLGHLAGDRILKQAAFRLGTVCREQDELARLSGDEFAVLLGAVDPREINTLVNLYRKPFLDAFETEGISLDVSLTIGVALHPDHGQNAGALLQRAEIAMYLAKARHLPFMVYNPQLDRHSLLRLTLMAELRAAIERNELTLYVQPKLDLRGWRIIGVECLVRWVHPEHGFVPPDEFIPLAEQTGNIRHLTAWIIAAALDWSRRWHDAGYELKVAVNLSTVDLLDPAFPERVSSLLQALRLSAESLILEVTESAVMEDPERAIPVLRQIRDMGIGLSIDDYGTGYSSMAQLKRLPVDELKIDKSFVKDVVENPDDAVIVRSTIELGHNMDLVVVAEGVEDEKTLEWLSRFGCDMAQGYHLSRPMPAKDLVGWLENSPYLAASRESA